VETEARRDLQALEAIAENERITQRRLSTRLGIALGLTNLYLKRLARKGYIKCVNIQSNRIRYLITPRGISEKTRLTYEFLDYSLHLYRGVRQQVKSVLEPLAAAGGHTRVALYGTGEAAELAYLTLMELGLEVAAVYDRTAGGSFLGRPVLDIREADPSSFDVLLVASLNDPADIVDMLLALGVSRDRLVMLREGGGAVRLPKA